MNVAVIGASHHPHRYSYQAVKLLQEKGYRVYPVHPRIKQIEGLPVFPNLDAVPSPLDVITLYVSPDISESMTSQILARHPRRLIFNPGAENDALAEKAQRMGIETLKACTLVMLRTGQF